MLHFSPVAFYGKSVNIHQSHRHSNTCTQCAQTVDLVIFHTEILIQFNYCIWIRKFAVQKHTIQIINIRNLVQEDFC